MRRQKLRDPEANNLFTCFSEPDALTDDKTKHDKRETSRVAADEDHDVACLAKRNGSSNAQVVGLIEKHGNDRAVLNTEPEQQRREDPEHARGTTMDPNITAAEVQDCVRARAYELWEAEGRPEGRDKRHWLAAERDVLEQVDRTGATGPTQGAAVTYQSGTGADPGERQDALLDEAVEETFPASDPVSSMRIT